MDKISLPFFYTLGARLSRLAQTSTGDARRIDVWFRAWQAKGPVGDLLEKFGSLTVCRQAGEACMAAIEAVDDWFKTATAQDLEGKLVITDTILHDVVGKAKEFETVLMAELQTLATYEASQKGIYSTPDLIERAEKVLPKSVTPKIPSEAVEEIREAGRCLAFDTSTAAGFHMMRATEVVLHAYYLAVCKPKPKPKARLDNWGAYIAELNKSTRADVKEVVSIIQQVKDQHRNLIMHPEVVLSPDEAFTLFEIAQGAIIAMAQQLKAPKK